MWVQNRKREGEYHRAIEKGVVVEDAVVGHKRYANLAKFLDMPYSLGNIMFGKQATHEAHRGALGQSLEEQCFQKQQTLILLNGSTGALEVRIVRREWLRGRTRPNLTKVRGWMMGCGRTTSSSPGTQ